MEEKNYPNGWQDYCRVVSYTGSRFFGFTDDVGDVNRFAARFRAGKSFNSVVLDGYSDGTERGYSALIRVMLVYSAFEAYMKVSDRNHQKVASELDMAGSNSLAKSIRDADAKNEFYKFIHAKVNPRHQQELDSYFKEDPFNVIYLASAIRHIFAHGWLAPNVNGVDASVVRDICNLASDFLVKFMDDSFASYVEKGMRKIYGP